jgi:hypothetical protein
MSLTPTQYLTLALDPTLLFTARGFTPDPWQRDLLRSTAPRVLLNCSRQAGKTTAVAALALHTALFRPGSLILLVAPVKRQSDELYREVQLFYATLGRPIPPVTDNTRCLELDNGSRVISLPGEEGNVRGYSGVALLVIEEAARVDDDLYRALRPMLAVSRGRLICLSTPFGRRGFFYESWIDRRTSWQRFEVPATQVSRISQQTLDTELRILGPTWFRQEFGCSFETRQGLVYPDFAQCAVTWVPPQTTRRIGGLDFGFDDPTAAVWGFLDADDVFWVTGEYYHSGQRLHHLAKFLPRDVKWYADPSGAVQRNELRRADFVIVKAQNARDPGIAAVTARLQTGRLKVLAPACPHLLAEAELYSRRRPTNGGDPGSATDGKDHALDALRYAVATVDRGFMVRFRHTAKPADESKPKRKWLSIWNEQLWTPLN